jgi:hypothetical protein
MKHLTKKTKIILSVLVALAVLILGVVYWKTWSAQRLKDSVYGLSKHETLLQLKSPSTAQFSETAMVKRGRISADGTPDMNASIDVTNNEPTTARYYDVQFIVDAQNSYGAMIRDYWSCYVVYGNDTVRHRKKGRME